MYYYVSVWWLILWILVRTQSHLMMTFSIPSCFSQSSFLESFRQWGRKSWFAIFFVFVKNLLIIVIIRKDFFLGSLKLKKFNYISSTWFDLFDDFSKGYIHIGILMRCTYLKIFWFVSFFKEVHGTRARMISLCVPKSSSAL